MKAYLLGIDVGTSALKVVVFDREGNVIESAQESYLTYYPESGFAEQDPEDWWRACTRALQVIFEGGKVRPEEIAAVGIDGQGWANVLMDREGNTLSRTPIWLDTRSETISSRLNEAVGEDAIFALAGNQLRPSYSTGKLLWTKEHQPEAYRETAVVLQSNAFIVKRLTAVNTLDRSQAYAYHFYDMRRGVYDAEMAKAFGVDLSMLPPIVESTEIVGTVSKKAAEETGLLSGTPVAAGGLDAACATLGAGVIHGGETQEQGGQAGGMSICMEEYRAEKALILGAHVLPGRYLLQGGTTGGGGVMRWLVQSLSGPDADENAVLKEFNELAEKVPAGSDGLVFLPYMAGERSPLWDPHAKGVYYGLDFSKTRGHFVRSAMEGTAFALLHNLKTAENAGVFVDELRATGGSANSVLWTQIKADICRKKILVTGSSADTALGAALLAGLGSGYYKDEEEAVQATVRVRRTHTPSEIGLEQYEKNYTIYLKLYEQLKEIMDEKGDTFNA